MSGGIIGWAVSRPVTVTVGVILVTLFGAVSIVGIPIQLTPDVTVPTVSVTTVWPGATPSEIEAEILEEQEEALKSLPGLERMTSEARRDQGTVNLELGVGADLDEALVRVGNLLSQVPSYPDAAREPVISTANATGSPMAVLVVQSEPPGASVEQYRTWLEEVVLPRFERIKGVANVVIRAGREQVIYVDFDPAKVAARGLSLSRITSAIRAELRDISGGDIPSGKRRYVVRTMVLPKEPSELARTVLATGEDGTPVTLGDVATVHAGLRKADAIGLVNGAPMMALLFFRESGSNVLEVTREIQRVTDEVQGELLAPEGLSVRIVSDQTGYITGALSLVRSNLLLGAALAVVVLLLFLRSVGASAVVAISIPVSTVGTVLFMSLVGRTVNIVSLAGMAFAVGMVVDNSIVVLENIDTWRQRSLSVAAAAVGATREVWGAILASTLTTAAVFIPIIAWRDEVGQLVRDVAVAVATAVFVSLVVSVLVIPSFAALLLKGGRGGDEAARFSRVRSMVRYLVDTPIRSLVVSVVGIAIAVALSLALLPSLEYLPKGNRNIVFGVVVPPPGYSVEEVERIAQQFMSRTVPHTGVERDGVPALNRSFFVGGPDNAFLGAVAEDPEKVAGVQTLVRSALAEIPDVIGFANQASLFGQRMGGGRSIEIDITGANLGEVVGLAGRIFGSVKKAVPGAQVRPIPGLDLGAPELQVRPNRAEAARHGLDPAMIGLLIDAYVDGAIIGEMGRAGEPKRDVLLRAIDVDIDDASSLLTAPLATPKGERVPVSRVADVSEGLGPTVIQRIERRRAITLQVAPPEDVALEDAIAMVRGEVAGLQSAGAVPEGVRIDYSGSAGKLDVARERFGWVLLFALLITYLLLAALFEDFVAPIAILVTVPLAAAGGIVALALVDRFLGRQPLDMMTALGFIILIGVVVNNAILIVDGALARMREEGADLRDAVADAVRWRVRPILMSALTSLAGLLPMVLFTGSGSELYRGVGAIVLGGLALSTALSLFLVPTVFTGLWRLRRLVSPVRTPTP